MANPRRNQSQEHHPVSTTLMVGIAGTIAITTGKGDFDLWSTMIGIVLVLVLHAYDTKDDTVVVAERCF
jgi:hypothetical protein